MTFRRVLAPSAAFAVVSVAASAANADPPSPGPSPAFADRSSEWRPAHDIRIGTADYVTTAGAVALTVGARILPMGAPQWRGGILFDDRVRDALRVGSLEGRYGMRDASDVGVSLASTWPFLVDGLVTAWWHRGRADVAYEMSVVSAEAFAIAIAIQGTANHLGRRERPFGGACGGELPEQSVDCDASVRYRSFFSGHATLAFTGASLICVHHFGLGLLGPSGDTASCVGGILVAASTSTLRVMSDMHYASDVVIGALVGTAVGITVPILHMHPNKESTARSKGIDVRLAPVGTGLGLVGSF